ncbi:MAG: hypothetical protein JW779_11855, partial [Candidatus Thorarchaeota archaeon]|nr:hypothetical protein [Candidatus Thorarchaeota archaeon]
MARRKDATSNVISLQVTCTQPIVPGDGKTVKYSDESPSCPQKSPRVPRNMVQCMGTIVRDR